MFKIYCIYEKQINKVWDKTFDNKSDALNYLKANVSDDELTNSLFIIYEQYQKNGKVVQKNVYESC